MYQVAFWNIIYYHFGYLGFGTFDLQTGNSRPHADLRSRDGPLQLEADLIRLRTLKDLQSVFILDIVEVDLGTQQLVTFTQRT